MCVTLCPDSMTSTAVWALISCIVGVARGQTDGDVRLAGESSRNRGRLEVFYNSRWGSVCDDSFDVDAAIVVCRQLGLPTSRPNIEIKRPGPSFYNLDDVRCTGNEEALGDCQHRTWGTSDCSAEEHVLVACAADPCKADSCAVGGVCRHVMDSNYICDCIPGYTGTRCQTDVDECVSATNGCSHSCVNTPGAYHCQCPDELQLGADNHTCYSEGVHVSCTSQNMQVELDKRHLLGLHGRYLTLWDRTCSATDTPTHVYVTVPLEGCGTRVTQDGDAFVYENQVQSHTVPVQGLVTRVRDVNITVRCYYGSNITAGNFYVVDTGELHFTDHEQGVYQISMDLIHNGVKYRPNNTDPLTVEPGEKLSIKLSLHSNDSHLQVFARNCKATPTDTTHTTEQYLVVDNGCSTDSTLTFKNVSDVTQETLTLETFKFDNSSSMYFHCEVLVCNVTDPDSRCHHGCLTPGRGRRDVGRGEDGQDVYLASHELAVGPVELQSGAGSSVRMKKSDLPANTPSDPETGRAALTAGLALLGVALIMITVALSIIFKNDEEGDVKVKDDAEERLINGDK
ncbi:deleted in malignant brain tumors 1 protein-like [Haliotis rufescens]|uniref:deleted in malignant brain tumors 1 protein-like n=1 Tax=Haliotis rufescens TaxID=6454 RepID=UPI00201F43B2|nr:deleted in malignant brain tumors 1 protein-like [Haliotis rufescens]